MFDLRRRLGNEILIPAPFQRKFVWTQRQASRFIESILLGLPGGDGDFIQSQLVRYGCLLACAAIEQALIDAAVSYANRFGDVRLSAFVSESLKTGRNPSPGYIKEVLSKFDPTWGSHIGTIIDSVGEDKIKSIVSNRNRIAHGESVSMGVTSLLQWLPAARQLCLEIVRFAK